MNNFPLPFCGLGFDLSRAARPLRIQIFTLDQQLGLETFEPVFSPWGFKLLVHLSRETRGS
ncbi:MAG: hypothetical protein ACOCPN_00675 [Desulfonatronovibrionaceae bacterium]